MRRADDRDDVHESSDDAATVAQRPSARAAGPSSKPGARSDVRSVRPVRSDPAPASRSTSGSSGSSGITDSVLAGVMIGEEVTRAHGFSGVIALACFGVVGALPSLGGDPLAKRLCAAALLVMGVASLSLWRYTRAPFEIARYKRGAFRAYGWALVFGATFVEHYSGYFSPMTVVLALGAYYLGQSSDRSYSFILPISGIAIYTTLATLTAFDVIPDRGLFPVGDTELSARLFSVVAAFTVLTFTLRMARVSRTAVREAIERSNDALLVAQRREAQLAEANHQLDRALRVAVGKRGRHSDVQIGDYRLGVVIGIGAVGEVYEAESSRDGSRAAVKLLQEAAADRRDLVERIQREGAISGKLDHPHTVRVFGTGRLPTGDPYLLMELLAGRDLAARLRQEGSLSIDEVERLAEQLGAGLQHAHELGVVHRDLKPLNIFEAQVKGKPCWKILDFGVSKLDTSSGTLTQEGVVGTPSYMSPEQARGGAVDHRSDVFSLAVVLYRALTGQPAFSGDSTPQVMFDVVYKVPRRPGGSAKGLSLDIDRVMAIAMAKSPDDRFQSASEFAQAFALACHRRLSPPLRERADALIERYPWGSSVASR